MATATEDLSLECPCGGTAWYYPSSDHVYGGRDFGPLYECPECLARVGVHKQGKKPWTKPLGTPAGASLRRWRNEAHRHFDALWVGKGGGARRRAYSELSEALGIETKDCHIGMFDVDMCKDVINYSKSKAEN